MSDLSLDNFEIDVPCPNCDFTNPIWFKQARLRDVIICRGCHCNIQLDDQMNECRKANVRFKQAMDELDSALKSLSIEINL